MKLFLNFKDYQEQENNINHPEFHQLHLVW